MLRWYGNRFDDSRLATRQIKMLMKAEILARVEAARPSRTLIAIAV